MPFVGGGQSWLLEVLGADVLEGARGLLGATLVCGELRARIVETEAYRSSDDPASHAFRGVTPRSRLMFGAAGRAYVYFNYGVHWMLNVTAHAEGDAAAVLIRAAVPLAGIGIMRERRGGVADRQLLSGPGKLTQAFGIDGSDNGADLLGLAGRIGIEAPVERVRWLCGPRVGIAVGKGHEIPWRFVDAEYVRWASKSIK